MALSTPKPKQYSHEALLRYARMLGFGDLHYRIDTKSGLQAIIAVHSTLRGPAIGGCRFYSYPSYGQALKDALRLASMMTVKAAACDLPHGGAKAVIIVPKQKYDRKNIFKAFGDFVNDLNGDYITAMDVGTTTEDMDAIAENTPHVIGSIKADAIQEDPSPYTAIGILRGIQAAVKFKYNQNTLTGLKVAIQGLGKVGFNLARHLYQLGAEIIASDISQENIQRLLNEFNAKIVEPNEIASVDCDIFSPCALGGTLSVETVTHLHARIVAGCANNQLTHRKVSQIMHERKILYAPDFIINSGGLIQAASIHDYHDVDIANDKINKLYDKLYALFERAEIQGMTTTDVAYQIAYENLINVKHPELEIT